MGIGYREGPRKKDATMLTQSGIEVVLLKWGGGLKQVEGATRGIKVVSLST